ncbi:MAG: hypothetical protein ABSD39_06560 [Terriglobales bacterium]|jgi:hypothetical protein
MRILRFVALLPAASALLIFFGCHKKQVVVAQAVQVHINNCAIVTPDPTQTNEGDSIQWFVDPPDTSQYTITFTGASPVPAKSFPSSSAPQLVTPDSACRANPQTKCTYKYSLTRITTPPSQPCIDPGVHVVPN